MTATFLGSTFDDAPDGGYLPDEEFEDELVLQMRLAELAVALSGCSAQRAFRLVRQRGNETPIDRLARTLAATRTEIAAPQSAGWRLDRDSTASHCGK